MELKDTIEMMNSTDYKERFKAKYFQNVIRYNKLDTMTVKYEAGTLEFEPKCSLELLKHQKSMMGQYIRDLKIRAEIEGIDLTIMDNCVDKSENTNSIKWTRVKDDLPEQNGIYLVIYQNFYQIDILGFAKDGNKTSEDLHDEKNVFFDYNSECGYYPRSGVAYWSPLPKLPKELTEGK